MTGPSSVSNSSASRARSIVAPSSATSRQRGEASAAARAAERAAARRAPRRRRSARGTRRRRRAPRRRARPRRSAGTRRRRGRSAASRTARRGTARSASARSSWQRSTGSRPLANSSLREVRSFALRRPQPAPPRLAVLRDEVDADRAPVAHEVVEQEARRAVVAQRVAQVVLDHVEPHAGEHVRVAGGDRLEHEQHAPGEVGVRVVVEPDAQQVGRSRRPRRRRPGARARRSRRDRARSARRPWRRCPARRPSRRGGARPRTSTR